MAEMKSQPYCFRYAWQSLIPAIFAIAYGSFVGSRRPERRCSSLIGCGHSRG